MDEMFGSEEMKEILHDFLVETAELIEDIDRQLIELENEPDNTETLNSVFRAVHTIKGASGFLGLKKIVEVAHKAEELLDKLRQGTLKMTPIKMDILLDAVDMLRLLMTHLKEDDGVDEDTSQVLALLGAAEAEDFDPSEEGSPEAAASNDAPPVDSASEEKPEPEARAETPSAPDAAVEGEESSAAAKAPSPAEEKASGKPRKAAGSIKKEESETIRVDTERLDSVMNMVGELVLGRNRLMRLASRLDERHPDDKIVEQLLENSAHIDLITTDLQLSVMKTRMQPIAKVFGRFPRMVRDLARDKQKEVSLVLVGEDTELDKTVIEEIGDPLVHLVRNSVDHGIELPATRSELGKPEKGTLTLSAYHKGNNIFVSIEDDGKGIDAGVIKGKAVDKGLISKEEAERMTDKEAFNLIFLPGFSTAPVVTDTSGRGVGMDVVKTNISKLNGSIDVESVKGEGSKMVLRLPLTLAIIQSLIIGVGRDEYALPLSSVVEILKIDDTKISTIEGNEALYFRDKVYPLLRLTEMVGSLCEDDNILADSSLVADVVAGGVETADDSPPIELSEEVSGKSQSYAVLMANGEKVFGLLVEKLVGQEEVVIKSMGGYLSNIKGVSGATITGDGRVVLIVDVVGLFAAAR